MKANFLTALTAFALMAFVFLGSVNAQDTNAPAAKDTKTMENHSMMGKMDMAHMHTMMGDCMKMQNDGKMCEQNTMTKCQENMTKGECKKMMKHTKAQSKTKTK